MLQRPPKKSKSSTEKLTRTHPGVFDYYRGWRSAHRTYFLSRPEKEKYVLRREAKATEAVAGPKRKFRFGERENFFVCSETGQPRSALQA
jgi:hypothetical protein